MSKDQGIAHLEKISQLLEKNLEQNNKNNEVIVAVINNALSEQSKRIDDAFKETAKVEHYAEERLIHVRKALEKDYTDKFSASEKGFESKNQITSLEIKKHISEKVQELDKAINHSLIKFLVWAATGGLATICALVIYVYNQTN